jgi:aminopeptidase
VDERFEALAELAVHGANVQPGQLVLVGALVGQEEIVRPTVAAAYARGARYVDVLYFDPWVKRARIEHAADETLDFVPSWLGSRLLEAAGEGAARISFGGAVSPDALEGLDGARLARDLLPWLKESMGVINDRSTNWCVVPCPTRDWAALAHPELGEDEAYEQLWGEIWHIMRLDEPDAPAAWDERFAALSRRAALMNELRFDALELRGPGTELTVGLLPSSDWLAGEFVTRAGLRHIPNLPSEEIFSAPDPDRVDGHVTSTRPLVLKDGTIIRGLRVRFEGGRAVEVDADSHGEAMRAKVESDEGAARLGEVALVDGDGRIGSTGTIFFDTLLDENAASHIALGAAYGFSAGDERDRKRLNTSAIHIDFMIGSAELDVSGVTRDGERVPVMSGGDWKLGSAEPSELEPK